MKNLAHCIYTYKHRRALEYTIKKVLKDDPERCAAMLERATYHDLDKLVLYLFWAKPDASAYHKKTAPHHVTNTLKKSMDDYLEAIFDYECAGYTKPDKPENAYDTTRRLFAEGKITEETYKNMMSLMQKYGLDSSYRVFKTDPEGVAYLSQFNNVSEEDILKEVLTYVHSPASNCLSNL